MFLKNFIRFLRASLSRPFFKEVKLNKYEIIIQKKLEDKATNIKDYSKNLTNTHKVFSNKIYRLILSGKIRYFLNFGFIQQMFFIHNRLFIFREFLEIFKDKNFFFWKKILEEDVPGFPPRYFLYPKSSGNRIHQTYHLYKFKKFYKKNLRKFDLVFEFGGGYGNMARTFKKINPNSIYIIFDTKPVNLIQWYYLSLLKIDSSLSIKSKSNIFLINNLNDLDVLLNKYNYKNSLFIANLSLSEVPVPFRNKILSYTKNFGSRLISFQKKFENINNYDYFQNLKKNSLRKYSKSIIFPISTFNNSFSNILSFDSNDKQFYFFQKKNVK
tara:strand:- start:3424 stop:4404 length:981 start_codon:yes stop_codon:yes gene_type:complete